MVINGNICLIHRVYKKKGGHKMKRERGSRIADKIIKEFNRKKKYEEKIKRELEKRQEKEKNNGI